MTDRFRRRRAGSLFVVFLGVVAVASGVVVLAEHQGCSRATAESPLSRKEVLHVSAIPDEKPTELLRIYEPFVQFLSKKTGLYVKFIPVTDYAATVEGLAASKLDLVWLGGYTSVQAHHRSNGNIERLVLREEDTKFKSVFVASPSSGIKTLADLKGKSFSFGSASSTSGHLMPRYFLLKAGLNPEAVFSRISFSGAHDATAKAVEAGAADAGALNVLVWEKLLETKKVDRSKIDVFFTTPEYVDYCWTARKDLPKELKEKLRDAFLSLDPAKEDDARLLKLQRATRYLKANDADWKSVEEAAKSAGLLK